MKKLITSVSIILIGLEASAQENGADLTCLNKPELRVELKAPKMVSPEEFSDRYIYGKTEGGELQVGVLGCLIATNSNVVQRVFPGSDLERWGVYPGARILAVDGVHGLSGQGTINMLRGPVGSIVSIEIADMNGRRAMEVVRKPATMFIQSMHEVITPVSNPHYYEWCASQSQKW
jgi:predicted metalloprotease with PDZ domain